jgi:soluble lytic murein transglycosylase
VIRWLAVLIVIASAPGQAPPEILRKLPRAASLADYIAFYTASAAFDANDEKATIEALKPVWPQSPKSPLLGRSALLAARAYTRAGDGRRAIELLKNFERDTPEPDKSLALAAAYEAMQDNVQAALAYQNVYFNHPSNSAAASASDALARLRVSLAASYPNPLPQTQVNRALKLMDAGDNRQAREELEAALPSLNGAERDFARLRIGVTLYNARDNAAALDYFRTLDLTASAEASAERLYYFLQCARRLNNLGEVSKALDEFASRYPKSKWRMEALTAAANYYVVTNQPDQFEPLYRACYQDFPDSPMAANCHWRVAFAEYMRRDPGAGALLKEHLRLYPKSDKRPAAMYFLARLEEESRDIPAARGYYEKIDLGYPNYYYAVLARQRMQVSVPAPSSPAKLDFTPNPTPRYRIERAAMLSAAGLDDLAETELRYAAANEGQPNVMAVALARLFLKRELPERAIRYIKRFAPGYLFVPLDSAPADFWKLAFPLPYREPLDRYSKQEGLDPFLVAALIRQESEFDRSVVSHAGAFGLTQVLPSTGRELARRLGIKHFSQAMLFNPELNLQLGTRYFKSLLNRFDGRLEAALAAYNAGGTRALAWLSWHEYREPAEFVESIPFTETRNYVQVVIRNADLYRRLYSGANR